LLLFEDPKAPVLGLHAFRPEHRPAVAIPFFSYHAMVGLGAFFIGVTLIASLLLRRGTLFEARWLLWVFVFAVLGAAVANQLGWVAAEVGRQPWIVQPPILRGEDGEPLRDAQGFVRHATLSVVREDGTATERVAGLTTHDGVSEAV